MSNTQHQRTSHDQADPGRPGTTTTSVRGGTDVRSGLRRLGPRGLTFAAVGLAVAVLVLVVGLPADRTVFGEPLDGLTVPAALLAVLVGAWLTLWTVTTRARWRVVDIVTASVLGVAGGFLFVAWNVVWEPVSAVLKVFPPGGAVAVGVWLLPGVLGGLIIRKPGAAVYTEVVAATVSALVGNQWGFNTVWYGFLEGMGAEIVFAALLFVRWGILAAMSAGAGAGVVVGLLDTFVYYPTFEPAYKLIYLGLAVLSGIVIAGLGSWALTRALAATGALSALASGRAARRV